MLLQQLDDIFVSVDIGIVKRRAPPAVSGVEFDALIPFLLLFNEVLDHLSLAFGRGQVERSAKIIVGNVQLCRPGVDRVLAALRKAGLK